MNSDESATSVSGNLPTLQYVLELSTTINFAKGTYVQVGSFESNQTGLLNSPNTTVQITSFPLFANVTQGESIYWRFGVKNIADYPGPIPDVLTHERYIFGTPQVGFINGTPPPPPKKVVKKKRVVGTSKGG